MNWRKRYEKITKISDLKEGGIYKRYDTQRHKTWYVRIYNVKDDGADCVVGDTPEETLSENTGDLGQVTDVKEVETTFIRWSL